MIGNGSDTADGQVEVGPQRLAAMRARAAELEAKQAAAREVVRRAEEDYPDDPERMWAESQSAKWLTAEEWAELLQLRGRLGDRGAQPAGPGARDEQVSGSQ